MGSAEVVDSVVGSGVEVVDSVVGAGTGVITIVGSVVELGAELVVVLLLEVDLLNTVEVVVVGAAVTVSVFFEEDEEGDAVLDVSFEGEGEEGAALLVVGS